MAGKLFFSIYKIRIPICISGNSILNFWIFFVIIDKELEKIITINGIKKIIVRDGGIDFVKTIIIKALNNWQNRKINIFLLLKREQSIKIIINKISIIELEKK